MADDQSRVQLATGEVLFTEGDPSDHAYLIDGGRLQVSVLRDSVPHVLAEIGAGAVVGEMSLVDNGPRTATITALEPSSLQRLQRSHLEKQLRDSDPLVRHLLQTLTSRYRHVVSRIGSTEALGPAPPPATAPWPKAALRSWRTDAEINDALQQGQFVLHFQPIIRMSDDSVAGFEALIRWLHPVHGLIRPDDFIPYAEQSGSIIRIGRWVIQSALEALARLEKIGGRARSAPLFIAVNVSGRQFEDPGLVAVIQDACASSGVPADRLRLEITESALIDRMDQAAALMRRCASLGVRLAVDDFGTGYSALSYLYRLPVNSVKLARPFIEDLARYPASATIVGLLTRLARELRMDTVAEGIEKAQQASDVRSLGIEYGQGFFYGAGLPLMVAARYLELAELSSARKCLPLLKAAGA